MNYRDTWDLTTIPDDLLKAEWARRSRAKREYTISCGHDPEQPETCDKCRQRVYRRERRAEGKDK